MLCAAFTYAQEMELEWAKSSEFSGNGLSSGEAIVSDSAGNTYTGNSGHSEQPILLNVYQSFLFSYKSDL